MHVISETVLMLLPKIIKISPCLFCRNYSLTKLTRFKTQCISCESINDSSNQLQAVLCTSNNVTACKGD